MANVQVFQRHAHLAGAVTIPAYADNAMDSYGQVIENEQRESLRPLELAMFVQKKLQSGARSSEIARTLGKSRGYGGVQMPASRSNASQRADSNSI